MSQCGRHSWDDEVHTCEEVRELAPDDSQVLEDADASLISVVLRTLHRILGQFLLIWAITGVLVVSPCSCWDRACHCQALTISDIDQARSAQSASKAIRARTSWPPAGIKTGAGRGGTAGSAIGDAGVLRAFARAFLHEAQRF